MSRSTADSLSVPVSACSLSRCRVAVWSLPNLLRLVIASAAVELRAVSHAASRDCSLDVVAHVPSAADRFRLAVVTHARATGREWHDIAQRPLPKRLGPQGGDPQQLTDIDGTPSRANLAVRGT